MAMSSYWAQERRELELPRCIQPALAEGRDAERHAVPPRPARRHTCLANQRAAVAAAPAAPLASGSDLAECEAALHSRGARDAGGHTRRQRCAVVRRR